MIYSVIVTPVSLYNEITFCIACKSICLFLCIAFLYTLLKSPQHLVYLYFPFIVVTISLVVCLLFLCKCLVQFLSICPLVLSILFNYHFLLLPIYLICSPPYFLLCNQCLLLPVNLMLPPCINEYKF